MCMVSVLGWFKPASKKFQLGNRKIQQAVAIAALGAVLLALPEPVQQGAAQFSADAELSARTTRAQRFNEYLFDGVQGKTFFA